VKEVKDMKTMSSDLFLLNKELKETEQKIDEARGGLRLLWKRILSLSRTLGELMVRQGELKKEIEQLESKKRGQNEKMD